MIGLILSNNQKEIKKIIEYSKEITGEDEIQGINNPSVVLTFLKTNELGVLFMDVQFIQYTKKIKELCPKCNIIYLADDDSLKKEAFDYRASGYLVRPINEKKVVTEYQELRYEISPKTKKMLRVQCFGNFGVYSIDGKNISFKRSKSKELFAYLIAKKGTACTTKELVAALFEDDGIKNQRYIQQLIFSLCATLKENGVEKVLINNRNALSIDADLVDCDYYRFLNNDESAKRLYSGEFMMQYEWAEYILAYLDRKSL